VIIHHDWRCNFRVAPTVGQRIEIRTVIKGGCPCRAADEIIVIVIVIENGE
jgi:hypothetical protein